MILTDVSDTIHADSLALFALNIESVLNLEIGPVVWEISGGDLWPPPQKDVLLTRPQRGEG